MHRIRAFILSVLLCCCLAGPAQADTWLHVINHAGVRTHELHRIERAIQWQANHDLRWWWHTPRIRFGASGLPLYLESRPSANDDPQIPSYADGVHFIMNGRPGAAVYATQDDAVSVVLSHEVMELLVDPQLSGPEVCDPVAGDAYTVPNGETVSDFATPANFVPGSGPPWDEAGVLGGPTLGS